MSWYYCPKCEEIVMICKHAQEMIGNIFYSNNTEALNDQTE